LDLKEDGVIPTPLPIQVLMLMMFPPCPSSRMIRAARKAHRYGPLTLLAIVGSGCNKETKVKSHGDEAVGQQT
jgi:hypothetical protein